MSKELFDTIQRRVDNDIKPKIMKAFSAKAPAEDPESSQSSKYDFRDMKRDLESI